LQGYLNEFVFRFNRRFWPLVAFDSVLKIAARVKSPTYAGVIRGYVGASGRQPPLKETVGNIRIGMVYSILFKTNNRPTEEPPILKLK
jgi:hypothetical protein